MPPATPLTADEKTLYHGAMPWQQRAFHELAIRAKEARKDFSKPSSRIAKRNKIQESVAEAIKKLAGMESDTLDSTLASISNLESQIDNNERIFRTLNNLNYDPSKYINGSLNDTIFHLYNKAEDPNVKRNLGLTYEFIKNKKPNPVNSPQDHVKALGIMAQQLNEPLKLQLSSQQDLYTKLKSQQSADNDTFKVLENELLGSLHDKTHDHVKPLIEASIADISPDEREKINKEVWEDQTDYRKALIDEMVENFNTHIKPGLSYKYMQKGLWNSPAREAAERQAFFKHRENLDRHLIKIAEEEKSRRRSELLEGRHKKLQAAQLASNILEKQKEHANVLAHTVPEMHRQQLAQNLAKIEAANQIGKEQQAQEEAILTEEAMHEQMQKEHEIKQIANEAAITAGMPSQIHFSFTRAPENLRPNPAVLGAATLGATADALNSMNQRKKSGGLVQKFAPGGQVMSEDSLPAGMMEQYQLLQQQKNSNLGNSLLDAVGRMGSIIAQRHGEDPVRSFGHATEGFRNTLMAHKQAENEQRARSFNMMQEIQKSRVQQQQFLMNMDLHNRQLAEQKRLHDSQIGLNAAHAKAYQEAAHKPKLDKADNEILSQTNKEMLAAPELLEDLDRLNLLAGEIETGGVTADMPILSHPRVQEALGSGNREHIEEFDKIANDFVLKAASKFGAKAGARIAQMFKEAKPHRGMKKEAIHNIISKVKNQINEEIERGSFINDALEQGISPKKALTTYQKEKINHSQKNNNNFSDFVTM